MPEPRFSDWINLAAVPTAVSRSRTFTKLALTKWDALSVMDDALLVVSELVTNAVKATGTTDPGTSWSELDKVNLVGVGLLGFETSVVIAVWDCDPHPPVMKNEDLDAESGRGIYLIAEMAHRWGSHPSRSGKTVWAELILPPQEDAERQLHGAPASLPQRMRRTWPRPRRSFVWQHDLALLQRALEGLRNL